MKKILLPMVLFFSIIICYYSCKKETISNKSALIQNENISADTLSDDSTYIEKHIAFIDARVRSINSEEFVREIVTKDFYNTETTLAKEAISFEGIDFNDVGEGYDEISGDGIYTSAISFEHNEEIPYDDNNLIRSISQAPCVDENFEHEDDLVDYLTNYEYYEFNSTDFISITCKFYWYPCSDWTPGSPNCILCCFRLYECNQVTFGF